MADQRSFFGLDEWYAALSNAGDQLERLSAVVDFTLFWSELERSLHRSDGSRGGRPPIDPVLMIKVLVIQALYGLSDAQAKFQIWIGAPSCGSSRRWCRRAPWKSSSPGSRRISGWRATSRWAVRSWMPPSSRRRVSK